MHQADDTLGIVRFLYPVAGDVGQMRVHQIVQGGSVLVQFIDGAARPAAQGDGPSSAAGMQGGAALDATQTGFEIAGRKRHGSCFAKKCAPENKRKPG